MRARGREIYIITGVVAVVLIVAWYFLLFSPTQQRAERPGPSRSAAAQTALSQAKQEVVALESYKKTAPQSRAEIVRLGKMLPESEGIPSLIIELTQDGRGLGREPHEHHARRDDAGRHARSASRPSRCRSSGRYFDVEDFLYRLEEYVAFRNASFRVDRPAAAGGQLHADRRARRTTCNPARRRCTVTVGLNAYLWGGAAATRRREVRNEPEPAHAHVHRHRPHRRRGAGASPSRSRAAMPGEHREPDAGRPAQRSTRRPSIAGRRARRATRPRKQPLLDKFTSKDPFVPLDAAGNTGTTSTAGTTSTSGDHQPERQDQGGRHDLHGVGRATRCPSGRPRVHRHERHVERRHVRADRRPARERRHGDGRGGRVGRGREQRQRQDLRPLRHQHRQQHGGGGGGSSTSGHSITVLSISSQNGVGDGHHRGRRQDVLATRRRATCSPPPGARSRSSPINVGAQTVTIMHGDRP